jgi:hypothetical protein
MHKTKPQTLMFNIVLSTTARRNTICVPRWRHDKTAAASNDLYKGPPEVCGAKSHRAITLGTASVRAGKNTSDSNAAFDHAPTQGFRQHFGCPNDTKMSEGQANIHQGTTSLPTRG